MRNEAQSGKWNELNWNEYATKDLALGIGKQAGQAALQGAAISVGFDIAQKLWEGEEIEGADVVETALKGGAKEKGFGVIIAAAGMAAHLAGAMAAGTTLPVIGIPIKSEQLGGLDALLSTVQMPSGIPVATVAIDGAKNAAVLAVEILALGDEELSAKLEQFRADGTAAALKKDAAINNK